MQDADHPQTWEEDWEPKIERVIGLCSAHVQFLKHRHPTFAPKIVQSRNGLRADLVEQLLRAPIQRNPHRLMYASSPDRGLLGLLEVFRTIRFYERKAELHVFYGFDNMHKVPNARVREMIRILHARLHADGITLHGRLGQTALYREWLHSALYVHPTNFLETGHIALMEAQALGAIPIVNPQWATGEQLLAGVGIEGDGERDQLTLRHYAHAALYLLEHADELEETRLKMMQEARKRFDWEGVVDQYEAWAEERP
jgi:glycosyltransferase involved in cell wall biosynthesis